MMDDYHQRLAAAMRSIRVYVRVAWLMPVMDNVVSYTKKREESEAKTKTGSKSEIHRFTDAPERYNFTKVRLYEVCDVAQPSVRCVRLI